jgi:hypothetical protein
MADSSRSVRRRHKGRRTSAKLAFVRPPVAVADRAYQRLLELMAEVDFGAGCEQRLADINRVAAFDLRH